MQPPSKFRRICSDQSMKMAPASRYLTRPTPATLPAEIPIGWQLLSVPWWRLPIAGLLAGQSKTWAAQVGFALHPQSGWCCGNKHILESDRLGFESQVHSLLAVRLANSLILPDPHLSHLEYGTRTTHLTAPTLGPISLLGVKDRSGFRM